MSNFERDVVVIGCGPAGLCAAIEAAKAGAEVLIIDENAKPGGQLFKQIHKFFGSADHRAGVRGIDIGEQLLAEARDLNIEVWLESEACGIFDTNQVWIVREKQHSLTVTAKRIIIATGAVENALNFPGWTLPGVMGAGAAQTMINMHRVLPGDEVLMVGSGNVGVIVSYQLLQAGARVKAIVEAAPTLGGYGVHTAKVRRAGVPFYTSHTIKEASGTDRVERATLVALDEAWNPIPSTEFEVKVDTICIATGLTPAVELAFGAGCRAVNSPTLGGLVPYHDQQMKTSIDSIYIAGDISGVEEASTAMEEGRIAGLCAAYSLKTIEEGAWKKRLGELQYNIDALRSGSFGQDRYDAKAAIVAAIGG